MRIIYNTTSRTITARRLDDKRAMREPYPGEKLATVPDAAFERDMKYAYENGAIEGTQINGEVDWISQWKMATTATEKLAIIARKLNLT